MQAVQQFLQQVINGVQTGSVYALIAVGYTMVYGVLKFINFAHGDVYMVGAYIGFFTVTGYLVHADPAAQGIAALMICMVGCASLGALIERLAYRPLRNGLSVREAVPWAIFWSLYGGLFGFRIAQHIIGATLMGGKALPPVEIGFIVAAGITFAAAVPLLKLLFGALSKHVKPSPSRLTALITAIGISLLLENQGQAIFTANPRAYQIKGVDRPWQLSFIGVHLTVSSGRMVVLVAAVILTVVLVYTVRFTSVGRAIRAVSFDPDAAALMGIPTDRLIATTFIIGSALAGAAGFLNHGLTRINFDANVGIALGLKAFVAAVLGGIGSIEGAVLGGLLMGLAESFTAGSSFSTFKDAIAFVVLIIVLLVKPAGLMGRDVPEKV
ncbi:MAG: branched-chain amino acid ABC transporter permease [Armatimonadetes bacterium]|nr:branched-chain amino acid ABC transporter permease [Armatimonadota bacterium]MDE2205435.1 branched-chain amino acid ABC transporter permease [Armatimonadota bacterium]